jgi:hypothetical protein
MSESWPRKIRCLSKAKRQAAGVTLGLMARRTTSCCVTPLRPPRLCNGV